MPEKLCDVFSELQIILFWFNLDYLCNKEVFLSPLDHGIACIFDHA